MKFDITSVAPSSAELDSESTRLDLESAMVHRRNEYRLAEARRAAIAALDVAEKAWHALAGMCEVGPERFAAFEVYENVRMARHVQ